MIKHIALIALSAITLTGCLRSAPPEHIGYDYIQWRNQQHYINPNAQVVYDGYGPLNAYVNHLTNQGVHTGQASGDRYAFIWDENVQRKLDIAAKRTPLGQARRWEVNSMRYRFVSASHLYYLPHNGMACRMGVLYFEPNDGRINWERIESTFCKAGPQGQWLPML